MCLVKYNSLFFTTAEFIANLWSSFVEQVAAAFSALQLDAHTVEHRAPLQGFLQEAAILLVFQLPWQSASFLWRHNIDDIGSADSSDQDYYSTTHLYKWMWIRVNI